MTRNSNTAVPTTTLRAQATVPLAPVSGEAPVLSFSLPVSRSRLPGRADAAGVFLAVLDAFSKADA